MNIGILTRFFAAGKDTDSGIGQHYRVLADALAQQEHSVHVIYAAPDAGKARAALPACGGSWTWEVAAAQLPGVIRRLTQRSWPLQALAENIWIGWNAADALVAASERLGVQVWETHSYQAPALSYLRRRRPTRVVTRVSTTARQVNRFSPVQGRTLRWHAALERAAIRRSDALLTHTLHHRDLICADEHLAAERFAIVPHGLPDPGEPPRFAATNDSGQIEFLFVGRFEPRKGIDVLLAAIPLVTRAFPHIVFTLVGAGGEEAWRAFTQTHPDLAKKNRASYLGAVSPESLAALYRRCAVLVAPSRYESFGLIYPEAMSRGKPVIGCNAGGIPEVIDAGVTGLLAAPGDVASLADCIAQLAGDVDLRRRMGEAGRRDFVRRFSAAEMAKRSAEVYEAARRRPEARPAQRLQPTS
jgi:glycosyltransferase involved in cell wall biosynthesis